MLNILISLFIVKKSGFGGKNREKKFFAAFGRGNYLSFHPDYYPEFGHKK